MNSTTGVDEMAFGPSGELYVVGSFMRAGLKPSTFFGIWHPPAPPAFTVGIGVASEGNVRPSQSNGLYQVLSTPNLSQSFGPQGNPIPSGGANTSFTNPLAGPAGFFQIKQLAP